MDPEVSKLANSTVLWITTIIAVSLVIIQAVIFFIKSLKASRKMGISKEKVNSAIKTGFISSIGPSVVAASGFLTLLVVVGTATALHREVFIGNIAYELMGVGFAAQAHGVELTVQNLTPKIFVTALWLMAFGCIGYLLVPLLFVNQLEKIRVKMAGGKIELISVISSAAMLGAFAYFNSSYIVAMNKNTIAMVIGFAAMIGLLLIYKKTKRNWINEWSLAIAMFVGMIVTALL
jgi:hypothetical protein